MRLRCRTMCKLWVVQLVNHLRPIRPGNILGQSRVLDPVPNCNDGSSSSAIGTTKLCMIVEYVSLKKNIVPAGCVESVPALNAANPFPV